MTKQALEAAKTGTDLYALVGDVTSDAPVEDIRRAWRRRNLRLHPDKAGDKFDPDLYGRFSEALAILESVEARAAYDNSLAASLAQKRRHEAMDADRKRMVDDLVAREKAAATGQPYIPGDGVGGRSTTRRQREEPSRREAGEERRRREMREMKEHDRQRLDDERERLKKLDETERQRSRREDDERAQEQQDELERRLREKKRRRERKEEKLAERVAAVGGTAKSGREAWRWTRLLLVQEQRIKEARLAEKS